LFEINAIVVHVALPVYLADFANWCTTVVQG